MKKSGMMLVFVVVVVVGAIFLLKGRGHHFVGGTAETAVSGAASSPGIAVDKEPAALERERAESSEENSEIAALRKELADLDEDLMALGFPEKFHAKNISRDEVGGVVKLLEERENLHAKLSDLIIEIENRETN